MSHTHHDQTYLRRQVSKQNKNEGGQISVNAPRPKRRYLPGPKPQATQRHRQPKSAPYFSREATNRFGLTPIIPAFVKDLEVKQEQGPAATQCQRAPLFDPPEEKQFQHSSDCGGHKESCHTEILPSPGDEYFSLVKN